METSSENFKEKHFEPKAHILSLLGEELIKSPVMAIYELIKNSYDADARKVDVSFNNIEDINTATIVITDNGIGMTEDIIENVWLEPGTDFRKPVNLEGERKLIKSPIYKRIPMGEKGVGRFAVHKLSKKIKLTTRPLMLQLDTTGEIIEKKLADYEIVLSIDWNDFRTSKYLRDVKIRWQLKNDINTFYHKNSSGTRIELSDLKEEWTKVMARQLKRHTISMLSPKNNEKNFKINLDFKNQWLLNFPSPVEVLNQAPYKLVAFLDDKYNLTFEYKFHLNNNQSIGTRVIENEDAYNINIKGEIRAAYSEELQKKDYSKEDIERLLGEFDSKMLKLPFGSILIEMYSYDLDSISMRDYASSLPAIKDTLKEHSGIKVFKGDLRVYDYGDTGNDWLGLDLLRVQNKEWFSNNQNIGYVYLDPESSLSLIEKTNREGFIENEAYEYFKRVIIHILTQFKAERQKDRTKWRKYNKTGPQESLENQFSNLKYLINDSDIKDEGKKSKLLEGAEKIEHKYEEDKRTLLLPAGVGMTTSFALHEIEKLVPRLEDTANRIPINEKTLKSEIAELKEYVDGVLTILKKGGNKSLNVLDVINQAISNYSIRLKNREIDITVECPDSLEVNCDKRYLITILMNIIDNSIYWLDTIYKNDKGIFFKAAKSHNGISILVVDNGPGFKDEIEDIILPFFTRKEGGIGIGMYLIDTIMMQYGKLDIIQKNELPSYNVPPRFSGAAVKLNFSKNQ